MITHTSPETFPEINPTVGDGVTPSATALLGGVAGVAVGAAAVSVRQLGRTESDQDERDQG